MLSGMPQLVEARSGIHTESDTALLCTFKKMRNYFDLAFLVGYI